MAAQLLMLATNQEQPASKKRKTYTVIRGGVRRNRKNGSVKPKYPFSVTKTREVDECKGSYSPTWIIWIRARSTNLFT